MTDYTIFEEALRDFELAVQNKLGREGMPIVQPFVKGDALAETRGRLVLEEANELDEALTEGTKADVAKEAIDLIYVAVGTLVRYGIPLERCFMEVHENNMAKIEAATVNEWGKLVKPKQHPKPDMSLIVGH